MNQTQSGTGTTAERALELQALADRGDRLAAREIQRRATRLASLQRKLARHLARPEPATKRAATLRVSDWYEIKL